MFKALTATKSDNFKSIQAKLASKQFRILDRNLLCVNKSCRNRCLINLKGKSNFCHVDNYE